MEATDTKTNDVPPKRAYSKPTLVEYGNVRELTRGLSTKSLDYHAGGRQNI